MSNDHLLTFYGHIKTAQQQTVIGTGPAQSSPRCTEYNTHQRPVHQLHDIRCDNVIAFCL